MQQLRVVPCTHPLLIDLVLNAPAKGKSELRAALAVVLRSNRQEFAEREHFCAVISVVLGVLRFDEYELAAEYGISVLSLRRWASGENPPRIWSRVGVIEHLYEHLIT